jgi:hypothetical protein
VDNERFDAIARRVGSRFTRRGALGVLAGVAALGLGEGLAKRKHRGKGSRKKRGKSNDRKLESGAERASPGKSACRGAGHPCEGNQECCNPETTICVPSGPGAAARCTPCSDGQIACANTCIPACTALDQCHMAGVCDPNTGACTNPIKPNNEPCNDGNACTRTDTCQEGVCAGSNPVVCQAKDQCHLAGTCDPQTGACSNPKVADGTTCTTAKNTPGTCVDGACKEICLELKARCDGASPCCDGLECDRVNFSSPDTCCIPTGSACPGPEADCGTGTCDTPCCGIDFGVLRGRPVFDPVACVQGICCNKAGGACRTTSDCCQSGPVPTVCQPMNPLHGGYCGPEGGGVGMCYQADDTPCTNQCQCASGYCVNGRCSADCRERGQSCDSHSACCSIGSCVNGVCNCC